MGRLLLIISKILGSKHLVVNRVLALVGSSRLITSRALADSKHMPVSQVLGSSRLPTSRILRSKHLVTSTTSAVRTLAGRALVLADSSRLTVNPALVSNSSLVVRASLSTLLHKGLILVRCKTSSPGKLLTSSGKEVTCPPGRVRNEIKVNRSLGKIKRLFPIIGSLVNSKASETFPVCLP